MSGWRLLLPAEAEPELAPLLGKDDRYGRWIDRVGLVPALVTAAAAAPLSASGTYGPLLLLDDPRTLPRPLAGYLLDLQPGYRRDPVRGVYNHGWLIGDEGAISTRVQARIDSALEIAPVQHTSTAAR